MAEMPLTANGKVDRRALPAPDASLLRDEAAFVPPRTVVEQLLAGIWREALNLTEIGIDDNFFELGGDSILSIQIVARTAKAGIQLTTKQLFQHPTISELAAVIGTSPLVEADQGVVTGGLPLTPIQQWFFEQHPVESYHYNQSILLVVQDAADVSLLTAALTHLLKHHDALRIRFRPSEFGWQQVNHTLEEQLLTQVDLSTFPEWQQKSAMERLASEFHTTLNLAEGPLVRAILFNFGSQKPARLLIIIHHLVVDGVSWRILLEDLHTAYQQLRNGRRVELPLKTTSFKQWSAKLNAYAQSPELQEQLIYWLAASRAQVQRLPVDYQDGENSVMSARSVTISLSVEETQSLLTEIPNAYHTQINDLLLMALVYALRRWTGTASALVDIEGHGREEIIEGVDVSRTVGWFTSIFPVFLKLDAGLEPLASLKIIKEQLDVIPAHGIGHGLLRYACKEKDVAQKLRALPPSEILFNYLGQLDQIISEAWMFKPATESAGQSRSPRAMRTHLIEINGGIVERKLQLHWTYSENIHQRATVENLSRWFVEVLRSVINHTRSGAYEVSDFADFGWNQEDVNEIIAKIGESTSTT
jgi:non-ribosomal peptide synthase protein (TIGR01720 family)